MLERIALRSSSMRALTGSRLLSPASAAPPLATRALSSSASATLLSTACAIIGGVCADVPRLVSDVSSAGPARQLLGADSSGPWPSAESELPDAPALPLAPVPEPEPEPATALTDGASAGPLTATFVLAPLSMLIALMVLASRWFAGGDPDGKLEFMTERGSPPLAVSRMLPSCGMADPRPTNDTTRDVVGIVGDISMDGVDVCRLTGDVFGP